MTRNQSKTDARSKQFALIGQIVAFMNLNGFVVWHQPNHGRFDVEHAAKRLLELVLTLRKLDPSYPVEKIQAGIKSILAESWRKVPHSKKGIGDIIGWHIGTGKFVAIEVKIGSDRLSEEQTTWLARLRADGGRAAVVSDFSELLRMFNKPKANAQPGASRP